jgi:hypothetical protein
LVGKSQGKRPLGRPRRRREGNIRIDLREIGWEGVDSMYLDQGRDQWRAVCKRGNEPFLTRDYAACINHGITDLFKE